jgi:hypothetical protein
LGDAAESVFLSGMSQIGLGRFGDVTGDALIAHSLSSESKVWENCTHKDRVQRNRTWRQTLEIPTFQCKFIRHQHTFLSSRFSSTVSWIFYLLAPQPSNHLDAWSTKPPLTCTAGLDRPRLQIPVLLCHTSVTAVGPPSDRTSRPWGIIDLLASVSAQFLAVSSICTRETRSRYQAQVDSGAKTPPSTF